MLNQPSQATDPRDLGGGHHGSAYRPRMGGLVTCVISPLGDAPVARPREAGGRILLGLVNWSVPAWINVLLVWLMRWIWLVNE